MAIIKCKMCGGDLVLVENQSVAECEYCGSRQTVPTVDNERKLTLFARASRLRAACEFDKAAGIYETIVAEFPEEAEAYWGLVLCKYGIEYVDDPATGKKIPTCHRSSFESIMEDADFEQTLENADSSARRVYREEAKQIEELRRGIIAVSANEQPYNIFICYKETDEHGQRTLDSVLAQDIYDALTEKGYRTFFSRISLEEKLGQEYEPYIFAALNSAKIMLAVGTDYEFYNAVWVKNEWSRYLKLMEKDKSRHLIPCYKGIDAYDMPREFAKLQAQDLGKMGAIQDILRGVEKLLPRKVEVMKETVILQNAPEESPTEPLLRRAFLFLEDGNWSRADEYCEKVLDMAPESAAAYLGKLLAELRVPKKEDLVNCTVSFADNDHYRKALRFASAELKAELEAALKYVVSGIETRNHADIENGILKKYRGSQRRAVIPSGITGIGKDAFRGCVSISSVEIPDSVTEIGSGVFLGCENLAEIRLSGKNPNFRTVGTCLIDRRTNTVISGLRLRDLPADGSIRRIGERAFIGNGEITELTVPQGVTEIGKEAFSDCDNLQFVDLPGSVTNIASDAFPHNQGIEIQISEDHPVFRVAGSCLLRKQDKTVIFGTHIQDLPADGSVTGIGEYAFCGCEMPEALEIPGCISSIGAYAFAGCSNLTEITFSGRTVKIADNAFGRDNGNLTIYAFADSDPANWAKKNRITTRENAEMKRISTAAFLDQGDLALKDGDFNKAAGFFDNALRNDSRNAMAYLGKTLVQEHCNTLGVLVRQRAEAYRSVSAQTLHIKENTEHIEEMVAKYSLPGYVDEESIRELYRFDLSYSSDVSGRQQQYLQAAGWWKNHRLLSDAEKYAEGDLAEQLQREKDYLLTQMNQRIQQARTAEARNLDKLRKAYAAHLAEADQAAERLYNEGVALREQNYLTWQEQAQQETNPKKLRTLTENFRNLGDYKDSAELAETCRNRIAEEQKKQAQEKAQRRAANAEKKKVRRKRARPLVALVAVITVVCLMLTDPVSQTVRTVVNNTPGAQYRSAEKLFDGGQYDEAIAVYSALGDYKDAAARSEEASYCMAEELLAAERYEEALAIYEKLHPYEESSLRIAQCQDNMELLELEKLEAQRKLRQAAVGYYQRGDREKSLELWNQAADRETISVGIYHTVGLRNDGTVVAAGSNWDYKKQTISPNGQCDVQGWSGIVDIEAGDYHTVGLKSDGTVVATGWNNRGQCDVSQWTDIVAVAAGYTYSAGLRADGTVMVAGIESVKAAAEWTDIISLAGGNEYIIGLKADGTTTSTRPNAIATRENVLKVAAGSAYVFLHEDGSVSSSDTALDGLENIEDVFAGAEAAICRQQSGHIHLNLLPDWNHWGHPDYKQLCEWNELGRTDLVAFAADEYHAVVLRSDGTVAARGENQGGRCNVTDWTGIQSPGRREPISTRKESARIMKEKGVALMENWQYEEAVAALKEAEACGIDCSAEIRKCEQVILTQKRHEPYVTVGEPIGQETKLGCTVRGNAPVHKLTRVELDNECVRYTVGCTIPESEIEFIQIFDSSYGLDEPRSSFWYVIKDQIPPAGRHTFVFDVRKEDAAAANEMSIRFGYTDNWIIVNNPY